MKTFDLYGFATPDLDRIRRGLEEALGIEFEEHESSFSGTYFLHGSAGEENLIFRANFDSFENEWSEPEFKSSQLLLYVSESSRSDDIRCVLSQRVPEATPLRRTEIIR